MPRNFKQASNMKRFLATPDLDVMVCDAMPGVDIAPNSRWTSKAKAEWNVGNNENNAQKLYQIIFKNGASLHLPDLLANPQC